MQKANFFAILAITLPFATPALTDDTSLILKGSSDTQTYTLSKKRTFFNLDIASEVQGRKYLILKYKGPYVTTMSLGDSLTQKLACRGVTTTVCVMPLGDLFLHKAIFSKSTLSVVQNCSDESCKGDIMVATMDYLPLDLGYNTRVYVEGIKELPFRAKGKVASSDRIRFMLKGKQESGLNEIRAWINASS